MIVLRIRGQFSREERVVIEYVGRLKGEVYRERVKSLLVEYDKEFVPPLSVRAGGDVLRYCESLLKDRFILAVKGDDVVGFLSFRHGYASELLERYSPSNYVTMVIVERGYRRRGIATAMYSELLHNLPKKLRLPYVTVRTWSTNYASVKLLEKLGFRRVAVVEDERGRGIHTLYYGIELRRSHREKPKTRVESLKMRRVQ